MAEKGSNVEDSIEEMKALRRQKMGELRQKLEEKRDEVRKVHGVKVSDPKLLAEIDRYERARNATEKGGLKVVLSKKKEG